MKKILLSLFSSLFIFASAKAQVPELWGMASSGGALNYGTIFKVNGDGTGFSTAYSFDSIHGFDPQGALCLAPNGKLYGMTLFGGTLNDGTLFSFNPSGNVLTKIVDFDMTNGGLPWGTMIKASNNKLYGASYGGGLGGGGSIFVLDPSNDSYNMLYSLSNSIDGGGVTDKLIQATNGKLYGMAAYGGTGSAGTIFTYDISTNTFTKIHDFITASGGTPYGSLCEASNGFMYGLTYAGGANGNGVLFKLEIATNTYTKLLDFNGTNGNSPWNSIIQVTSTKLYGLVTSGGTGGGVIFSYDISTGTYTVEHNISFNTEGALPWGSFIKASDGMLYSTLSYGPVISPGMVFKFDINGNVFTPVHNFVLAEGNSPTGDLVEVGGSSGIASASATDFTIYPNPSKGRFILQSKMDLDAVEIYKVTGEKIYSLADLKRNFSYEINMEGFPAGIYFVKMYEGDKEHSKKIVVEK